MFSADWNSVQVQLKEFASNSFRLSIESKSSMRQVRASKASRIKIASEVMVGRKKGLRFVDPSAGVIGASCLSIIGMIEPGRTVRLYRQIH